MKLFFFTNTYPYGKGETFIENEINILASNFDTVHIFPLEKTDNNLKRETPKNVIVHKSLLGFSAKNKFKLLFSGVFNLVPFGFAWREFFSKKVYKNKKHFWNFFTFLLLYGTLNSNKKAIKEIKQNIEKDDILYFYWADKSTLLLPRLKQLFNNRSFVRFHGTDLYEYARFGYIPFRNKVFPAIDYFLPISKNGQRYLLEKYPYFTDKKRNQVSYFQVNRLGIYDNGLNAQKQNNENFHIVSCSNLVPIKRVALIIDALMYLTDISITWTHIGSGRDMDIYQQMTDCFPDNITMEWKGQLSNKKVLEYYQKTHIDLFLNVSASEGIPVSIMEAMSFGIPAMATDVGGVSEIVNSENGVLLDKNISSKELREKIREFSTKSTQNLRENARAFWKANYNAEKNYNDFVQLLKKGLDL